MATQTGALEAPAIRSQKPTSLWRDAMGRLVRNRLAVIGLIGVLALIVVGSIGPLIAPYPYDKQNYDVLRQNNNLPVSPGQFGYLFGTDSLGRDLLSRMLDGARISLSVAIVVQVVVLVLGVPIGAIAGWLGGRVDTYLMRFTDVMYAFPDLLLIILMTVTLRDTAFGQALDGLLLVYVAIGLVGWVTMARLVRGQPGRDGGNYRAWPGRRERNYRGGAGLAARREHSPAGCVGAQSNRDRTHGLGNGHAARLGIRGCCQGEGIRHGGLLDRRLGFTCAGRRGRNSNQGDRPAGRPGSQQFGTRPESHVPLHAHHTIAGACPQAIQTVGSTRHIIARPSTRDWLGKPQERRIHTGETDKT